jgi:hypothetical protein
MKPGSIQHVSWHGHATRAVSAPTMIRGRRPRASTRLASFLERGSDRHEFCEVHSGFVWALPAAEK